MPDAYSLLDRTDSGSVATVRLARPDVRNALNSALVGEMAEVFEALAEDEGVRVVVLAGEGPVFCAGADVGSLREAAGFDFEENLEDARRLAGMFRAVDGCPKPVVAKVRGAAIGGGAGLAAAADVVVAAEGSVFSFPEVRLGISPSVVAPFVARKIGGSHARALFLTGESFGAARAREIGLVHEVVPYDGLDAAAGEKVSALLAGGPEALAATKGLMRRLEEVEPMDAPGMTASLAAQLRSGEEGQEGLDAFLEKREPRWRQP